MQLNSYLGQDPFIFISYQHSDHDQVEPVLRMLSQMDFRIWYDGKGEDITAGRVWRDFIDERLHSSSLFIVFLSLETPSRPEVLREIKMAFKKKEQDPSFLVIPIFLQLVPLKDFPPEIEKEFYKVQYINLFKYRNNPESFKARLVKLFLDYQVQKQFDLHFDNLLLDKIDSIDSWSLFQQEQNYIFPNASPIEVQEELNNETYSYYRLSTGETSPNAIEPLVLDNTWCSETCYQQILTTQTLPEKFDEEHLQIQQREICRGLLHARQIIVNRAALHNSKFFVNWYTSDAFLRLLENGSLVVHLFLEDTPWQAPKYSVVDQNAWLRVCKAVKLYCLKLDWDFSINQKKMDKLLTLEFHDFCISAAEDPHLMQDLKKAFSIPSEDETFDNCWRRIQERAISYRRDTGKHYTRELFYRDFVIKSTKAFQYYNLDPQKPFAKELKQIIDLKYNLNRTNALGVTLSLPEDCPLDTTVLDRPTPQHLQESIFSEELSFAISNFDTTFLEKNIFAPRTCPLSLQDVYSLRDLKTWRSYIHTLETSRKRARLWAVDYYDIYGVWEKYHLWLKDAQRQYPQFFSEEKQTAALTILYQIDNYKLTTVYLPDRKIILQETNLHDIAQPTTLTIDYVLGNIFEIDHTNYFYNRIRLFQGTTTQTGNKMIETIKTTLNRRNHVTYEIPSIND